MVEEPNSDIATPFLRWAGSKRWLLPSLREMIPSDFGTYYEPFLGSGAVFFQVADGHSANLSDAIAPLISCYETVRDEPETVATLASGWKTDADTYYSVRAADFSDDPIRAAARFIYLNKLCFNGLYRENQSGKFNVPYGRPKSPNVADASQLLAVANRLTAGVQLKVCDFEVALSTCGAGDLVYLDPPYVSGHRSNGFVDYNAKIFSWDDQRRLASVFRELDSRGVFVIQSNADHPSVRELYEGYEFRTASRYSSMAAKADKRGKSNELLILSGSLLVGGQL
ncbi:Dam family site-specific DNA-(adenine-N6)-methyltransferase [Arthrobacter sp. NPDC093128]|uniref:DNA adenine methylase n=1 Tax=Arthrobacter sp. NPDC093128 TaxID=3154979 RepID=UPI003412A035